MYPIRFQKQWLSKLAIALVLAAPTVCSATVIRMQTTLGIIDIQLYETAAPLTVANFLAYAKSGAYANSFIHRSVSGFIVQGGGFVWNNATSQVTAIATNPPVANEFDASRSNIRGTIAMAKLGNDPNSATNQWFFNLADNSSNLDAQNGGFTVFGKVANRGMDVADAIAALPKVSAGGPFTDLPIATPVSNATIQKSNLVIIKKVTLLPAKSSDPNRIFSYLESLYPDKLLPFNTLNSAKNVSKWGSGYYYRYYSKTKKYVANYKGKVYWGNKLGSSLTLLGTVPDLLAMASQEGY